MIEINVLTNKSGVAFKKQQSLKIFGEKRFRGKKAHAFFKFTDWKKSKKKFKKKCFGGKRYLL